MSWMVGMDPHFFLQLLEAKMGDPDGAGCVGEAGMEFSGGHVVTRN